MAAVDLVSAAVTAYSNVLARWSAGTIKANLLSFAQEVALAFNEGEPNNRPPLNWCAVLEVASVSMNSTPALIEATDISQAAQFVFNLCWQVEGLFQENLISNAQYTATLAAYNASID